MLAFRVSRHVAVGQSVIGLRSDHQIKCHAMSRRRCRYTTAERPCQRCLSVAILQVIGSELENAFCPTCP